MISSTIESPVQTYNREIFKYTSLIPDDTSLDWVLSTPEMWFPGTRIPKNIVRKQTDPQSALAARDELATKVKLEIPKFEDTNDPTSLEGIDPRDLDIGNIICAVGGSLPISASGVYARPDLHVFEVVDVPQYTQRSRARVREVPVNHPSYSSVLRCVGGEAEIWNPLIARGSNIQFISTEGTPSTAAIQALAVFRNRDGFMQAFAGNQRELPTETRLQIASPNYSRQLVSNSGYQLR